MGTYGFLRFGIPLFPKAATSHAVVGLFVTLAVIGILYAAWVAAVQPDAKKLVAYTSVAHLGFVMLGVFGFTAEGLQGGILQMVNHGISTGALFLLIGMLYERRHTRAIADFGGLAKVMPVFAVCLVVVALSSIGLPGTNGFVGEFLILVGTFRTHPLATLIATTGVIFAACYMLPMVQRLILNPLDRQENRELEDLGGRERAILVPLLALILLIGVYPKPFLDRLAPAVDRVLQRVDMLPSTPTARAERALPPGVRLGSEAYAATASAVARVAPAPAPERGS
jgi:NADH-quinone oxidoreductase subunit M